jgi:CRP-like cAMP-binding protein
MPLQRFQPGDLVFAEGDPPLAAYLVLEGEVEIILHSASGEQVLGRVGPGELFGDMALISEHPRSASARAVVPTTVEVLDEDGFEKRILQDPTRLRDYLATCVERVRAADAQLRRFWDSHGRPADTHAAMEHPFGIRSTPLPSLHLRSDPTQPGRSVDLRLPRLPFRIGRQSSATAIVRCDLALPDATPHQISRLHCEIDADAEGPFVRDCQSTLGTLLNGIRLGGEHARTHLRPGANLIILGHEQSGCRLLLHWQA